MISVTLTFPNIDAAVRVLREIPESALTSTSAAAPQQPAPHPGTRPEGREGVNVSNREQQRDQAR